MPEIEVDHSSCMDLPEDSFQFGEKVGWEHGLSVNGLPWDELDGKGKPIYSVHGSGDISDLVQSTIDLPFSVDHP